MNIAIVSAYFPPHIGGVEMFTANLARSLAASGHTVIVITSQLEGLPRHEVLPEGTLVVRLPTKNFIHERFPLLKRGKDLQVLTDEMKRLGLDAVVVNTRFYPISLFGARLARFLGNTPIVIEHGSSHLTLGNAVADKLVRGYEHTITNLLNRYQPRFFAVSELASEWLNHFGIQGEGIIHNSIDAADFIQQASSRDFRKELHIPDDGILVAYCGRIVKEKGIWTITSVANELESRDERFHFVMAGDGPELTSLISFSSSHQNLYPVGRLSRPDIASLLLDANIYCFPSSYPEGLPTALLEAAACSAYIVTSNVGGAREIVPSEDYGKVINGTSASAFTSALIEYSANKVECDTKAKACSEYVAREFSWEKATNTLEQAILAQPKCNSED